MSQIELVSTLAIVGMVGAIVTTEFVGLAQQSRSTTAGSVAAAISTASLSNWAGSIQNGRCSTTIDSCSDGAALLALLGDEQRRGLAGTRSSLNAAEGGAVVYHLSGPAPGATAISGERAVCELWHDSAGAERYRFEVTWCR